MCALRPSDHGASKPATTREAEQALKPGRPLEPSHTLSSGRALQWDASYKVLIYLEARRASSNDLFHSESDEVTSNWLLKRGSPFGPSEYSRKPLPPSVTS